MKKRLLILFFFHQFLLLIGGNNIITAQSSKSSHPSIRTQIKTETRPFAYKTTEDLPRNYLGHSYPDLLRSLSNREKLVGKGEFESTYDYNLRMTGINYKPLVGATNYFSRFAFTFLPNSEQFQMKYDPDRNDLGITVIWTHRSEFGEYTGRGTSLTWTESSRKVGSYIGRNAFNRSVRVSVYRNDSFYLLTDANNLASIGRTIDNRSLSSPVFMSYNGDFSTSTLEAAIPMSPNEARLAKVNLRILVVGHLADKSVFFHQSHEIPEITDPFDRHNFDYGINLVVEEVWIYDFPTGKVLLRFGANGAENNEALVISTDQSEKANGLTQNIQVVPIPSPENTAPMQGVKQDVKILSQPRAGYTDSARQENTEGIVVLSVTFLASGQIGSISAVKSLPNGLTEQAIAAARRIAFEPAKVDDVARTTTKQLTYSFAISERSIDIEQPQKISSSKEKGQPRPRTVSGGVLNGKAISLPEPGYPPKAKAAKTGGSVSVQVLIDEEGRVVSASAVSGHPLLQQAAVAAARGARFSPTLIKGIAVKVSGIVTYNFIP